MRPEKKHLVNRITTLMESSPGLFLITYKGLTAGEFGELRTVLAEIDGECHVVPNRLLKLAAAELSLDQLKQRSLIGDTAMVIGGHDVTLVATRLRDFGKNHPELKFKLAVLDGKLFSAEEAASLAELPSREVLYAQLLGLLQAPPSRLVNVLNAKVASVVNVLNAYLNEKKKAA